MVQALVYEQVAPEIVASKQADEAEEMMREALAEQL